MARFYRTDTVEAVQLTWDNWREVADLTGGRFHQGMQIDKSSGIMRNGHAFLMIPGADTDRRATMGWWIVEEGDWWIPMPEDMFRRMYRPAQELGF